MAATRWGNLDILTWLPGVVVVYYQSKSYKKMCSYVNDICVCVCVGGGGGGGGYYQSKSYKKMCSYANDICDEVTAGP